MNIIWIIDQSNNLKALSVPNDLSIPIRDIFEPASKLFNIHAEFQAYYANGKRIFEIPLNPLSEKKPIGLVNISDEPNIIINFVLHIPEKSFITYKIAIDDYKNKILFDALLILVNTFDLSSFLEKPFEIYGDLHGCLSFDTSLSKLSSINIIHLTSISKDNINLRINAFNTKEINLQCIENITGIWLRYHIALMLKKKILKISIYSAHNRIEDEDVLINLEDNLKLYVEDGGRGGNLFSICFSSFEYPMKAQNSDDCDQWRIVKKGLSWIGACSNPECKAFNDTIIVNQGYGVFDLQAVYVDIVCPICNTAIDTPTGCGVYKGKLNYYGVTENNEEKKGKIEFSESEYKYFNGPFTED